MADAGVLRAGDRLPWLEPYRAPSRKPSNRKAGLATVMGIAGLATIGALLAVRIAPIPEPAVAPSAEVTLPAPVDMQPQIALPPLQAQVDEPAAAPVRQFTASHRRKTWRLPKKIVTAGPERDAYESIMSEQIGNADFAPPAAVQPAPPPPRPVVNPTAEIVRGKTIQLGVYYSARQAELAWQSAIRDYTFLVTMPKNIEPISIRSKRYYRLQLGTPSKKYARQLCSNLKSTGRACTVA